MGSKNSAFLVPPQVKKTIILGLTTLTWGCIANPDDARMKVPGDFLGTYSVDAVLQDSSCGGGTLAAPGIWDFSVQLSRDERHLYWTNGAESLRGDLSGDGKTFDFTSEVSTTLKEAKPGRPGCVIWRQDSANGSLELGSEETDVPGFSGKLVYTYAEGVGSECSEMFDESGLTQLPCLIRYEMLGKRTD